MNIVLTKFLSICNASVLLDVELNELEELLYGESETAEEFLVREEQVNRQGRVNLD